jgi:hypothetical protein
MASHGNFIEIDNPELLAKAAEELLYDDGADLLVVRGLMSNPDLLQKFGRAGGVSEVESLYESIPAFHELDGVVADFWDQAGYNDYDLLSPHVRRGAFKQGSSPLHVDFAQVELAKNIVGPLSLSVGIEGSAQFFAQKPIDIFLRADGSFDLEGWQAWLKEPMPGYLRTSTTQKQGDGVFFTNHPRQTYHEVIAHSHAGAPARGGALFDYRVIKR